VAWGRSVGEPHDIFFGVRRAAVSSIATKDGDLCLAGELVIGMNSFSIILLASLHAGK
jgi:hypothetical protein